MANILIVDDESSVRGLIQDMLSADGYHFESAADGPEALEILARDKIDLAIVDLNMPRMGGVDVVKSIRRNPKTQAVKVLMCTASQSPKESDEAFAAGADDYISKPISVALLRDKVAWALTH